MYPRVPSSFEQMTSKLKISIQLKGTFRTVNRNTLPCIGYTGGIRITQHDLLHIGCNSKALKQARGLPAAEIHAKLTLRTTHNKRMSCVTGSKTKTAPTSSNEA